MRAIGASEKTASVIAGNISWLNAERKVAKFSRDRLACGERIAKIAMCEIAGITEELLDQRLVEAEFLADLLDRLLARRGARKICRGVARQRARQQERDDHDPDE